MIRKISFLLLVSLFLTVSAFAENSFSELDIQIPVIKEVMYYSVAVPGEEESSVPQSISNNEFYRESLRLTRLAQETFEFGDYDASAGFAQEALLFARLSDQYVAEQLIAEAKRNLDWADANNIPARFPNNYNEGRLYYEAAVGYNESEEWGDSIDSAIRSIEILAAFQVGTGTTARTTTTTTSRPGATSTITSTTQGLPRQYTVRTWRVERDCLWNIAGYPWVYNDPWRWPELYEANKSRMPDPNNPDLIEPGMLLEIPSIYGENR